MLNAFNLFSEMVFKHKQNAKKDAHKNKQECKHLVKWHIYKTWSQ